MKVSIASILLSIFSITSANGAETILKIATEGAYPPFNYVDASGAVKGFDIDIGEAICAEMNVQCEFVMQDWDGLIPGLLGKKYDLILASMGITPDRRKVVAFSEPYYKTALALATRKDTGSENWSEADLGTKTIGVQAGTTQADYVQFVYPSANVKMYPTQDEVNLDLINGRIDFQVADYLPLKNWVDKTSDGACCHIIGKPITDPQYAGEGIGIAARQEDKVLIKNVNKAINNIRNSNLYKTINLRYFDIDIFTMEKF